MSSKNIVENNYASLQKNRNVIASQISNILNAQYVNPCDPLAVSKKLLGNSKVGSKGNLSIGSGVYGTIRVYEAGDDKYFAVKTAKGKDDDLLHEYTTLKMLYKRDYKVPRPYALRYCDDSYEKKNMIYYEYADWGDLRNFLHELLDNKNTKSNLVFVKAIKNILTQVIGNLYEMQKSIKNFRHYDLHPGNVLVSKRGKRGGYSSMVIGKTKILKENLGLISYIHDFAFADSDVLPNMQQRRHQRDFLDYGIVKDSHPLYDVHFLLNSLYMEFGRNVAFAECARMITEVLPIQYIGKETAFVKNHRLRAGIKHRLPTIETVLKNPYFLKKKTHTKVELALMSLIYTQPQATTIYKEKAVAGKQKKQPKGPTKKSLKITHLNKESQKLQSNCEKQNKISMKKCLESTSLSRRIKEFKKKQKEAQKTNALANGKKMVYIPFTKDKDGEIAIKGRKCRRYKKGELEKILQTKGMVYKGKTIKQMCDALKKKYINKV
jgi:hypothetical protein